MKLQKIFLVSVILLASFQICFGQEQQESQKVDEFGEICSENLMARLDNFFIQLSNTPSDWGYIVFYGNNSAEGKNLNLINYINEFYPNRTIDKTRFVLLRGENKSRMNTQFWIVPAAANPPKPESEFTKPKYTSTTLFDKTWADFNKAYGKLDIYVNGFFDLSCDFSPNKKEFAKILLSNPELIGYLLIYTEFGKSKKYADKIVKFAVRELVKQHKVPLNQLKTIYGGNREEPEIEFWLVPKNEKPPIPAPAKKVK